MTATQKRQFIRNLVRGVSQEVIAKVFNMPEEWDSVELRQFLADKFTGETYPGRLTGDRKRSYRNEVIIRNL